MQAAPSRQAVEAVDAPNAGLRVLLVEDHDLLRPLLAETMDSMGHQVTEFRGVAEAMASPVVTNRAIDLLVTDVNLEDGDGVEFAGALELATDRRYPTIFVTGNPKSLGERALEPRQRLLHKPFGMVDLAREIELVCAALDRS